MEEPFRLFVEECDSLQVSLSKHEYRFSFNPILMRVFTSLWITRPSVPLQTLFSLLSETSFPSFLHWFFLFYLIPCPVTLMSTQ